MAVGTMAKQALVDIANAIREQDGGEEPMLPSEMANRILSLDGMRGGGALQMPGKEGVGIISDSYFHDIADAIRAQNGSDETYTPLEMPAAILALRWDAGLRIRALLLADGTLEFTYLEGPASPSGGEVVRSWEVDPAGYGYADAPWWGERDGIVRASFDASVADSGLASVEDLLHGCTALKEVRGFEALAGVANLRHMCALCGALESVFASGYAPTVEQDALQIFHGCDRLVGAFGRTPSGLDDEEQLFVGEGGLLTDPDDDPRRWADCCLYADGELVVSAGGAREEGREVALEARMCPGAGYRSRTAQPWCDVAASVARVRFAEDMATFPVVNLDYWFSGCGALASVEGMGSLALGGMRECFRGCSALAELDLSGSDPAGMDDVTLAFYGCSSLAAIYVDGGWALPEGAGGISTFDGCEALAGGAGTVYSDDRVDGKYMRVDGGEAAPGYLTVRG